MVGTTDNGTPVLALTETTCPARDDPAATADERYYRLARVSPQRLKIEGASLDLFDSAPGGNPFLSRDALFLSGFVFLLLFNYFFLDVNITSPHGFYRDRLSKAFLFADRPDAGGLIPNDEQKLSTLNAAGTAAPYHLINVALNLQGGQGPGPARTPTHRPDTARSTGSRRRRCRDTDGARRRGRTAPRD